MEIIGSVEGGGERDGDLKRRWRWWWSVTDRRLRGAEVVAVLE